MVDWKDVALGLSWGLIIAYWVDRIFNIYGLKPSDMDRLAKAIEKLAAVVQTQKDIDAYPE